MARRAADLATRFEGLVDRTGEHHLWLGATNPERGTGRMKVDNAQVTAHRVAWELAHGPLPPAARVLLRLRPGGPLLHAPRETVRIGRL